MLFHVDPTVRNLSIGFWIFMFAANFFSFLIPILAQDITGNYFDTGIMLSIFGLAGLLSVVPAMLLYYKRNVKRIFLGSMLLFATLPVFYTQARTAAQFMLIRAVHGIILSFIWVGVWIYLYKRPDGYDIAYFNLFKDSGQVLAPLIAGFVAVFSFVLPFYIAFFIGLLAVFTLHNLLPDIKIYKPDTYSYLFSKIAQQIYAHTSPRYLPLLLLLTAVASFWNFFPVVLRDLGFNYLSIGGVAALLLLPMLSLELPLGKIVEKRGAEKVLIFSATLMCLSLLINSIIFMPVVFYLTVVLYGIGLAAFWISFAKLMAERDKVFASGFRRILVLISTFLGSIFGGLVYKEFFIGFLSNSFLFLAGIIGEVIYQWNSSRRSRIEEE